MGYTVRYSCISHIGRVRKMNQDNFICNGIYIDQSRELGFPLNGQVSASPFALFGVFDGMGGEECGEVASYIAARESAAIKEADDPVNVLNDYCMLANRRICEFASNNGISSTGTTAAMLLFDKKRITLCNIGDSRIFRFFNGEIEQISVDHVSVAAYGTKAPLLQNLGIPEDEMLIEPYYAQGKPIAGSRFLICSDGLTDMVSVEEIREIVNSHSVEDALPVLVNTALTNGGRDNTTVILLEVEKRKNKF